jgi:hypothetical protein
MRMKKIFWVLMLAALAAGCKKGFNAEPTYARATVAGTWAKNEPFYQPTGERYDEATGNWRRFNAFTVTSEGEPDKLGFANPYVAGRGVNALDMNRLYSTQNLTSDSGYYNITIPKCFQFVPDNPTDITQGKVLVLPQDVKIYRRDKSFFIIKIAPGAAPGTYNTTTGVFEVEVSFDETSIGGAANVRRKYRFTA